ncbi:carbohydrate ABC transporter permease, partial [Escherichia coli]|nr:carbohydrate ABC transporter permease [Escherichia coli]
MTDTAKQPAVSAEASQNARKYLTLGATHIVLIIACVVMLYPLLWMLAASCRPEQEIFTSVSIWPSSCHFDAYIRGWNGLKVGFETFFKNSLVIALLSVVGNVLSCSMAAYAFARLEFRGRSFWFALMLMTMMLPYQVTLIPQY